MILIPKLNEIFIVSSVIGVAISFKDVYLFHIVFGFIILLSFRNFTKSNYKINFSYFSTKYIYFFPIFFCWYFLSIFWSINKIYTIQYLVCFILIELIHDSYINKAGKYIKTLYKKSGCIYKICNIINCRKNYIEHNIEIIDDYFKIDNNTLTNKSQNSINKSQNLINKTKKNKKRNPNKGYILH